ncbi:MAG: hypothetical protein JWQ12_216 [Glaciihabitans sp.]|nr:hypothetical protein [Glaciihabitans sp.]
MPRRVQLPPDLSAVPFHVRTASDRHIGEGRLRGTDLKRPFHAVRAVRRAPDSEADVVARAREYSPLLRPGQFFSHTTAARLWNCPLPTSFSEAEPLHVTTQIPERAPRSNGILGHQAPHIPFSIVDRFGLPVSDPVSTWIALAQHLRLDDLVAVADHLILEPVFPEPGRPFSSFDDLTTLSHRFRGRGRRLALAALPLVRSGAESRPETLLRLLLMRAGFPEPSLNFAISGTAGVLGRADIVFPRWRTIVEYDGDQHRSDDHQYEKDITRIENFVHANWRVVRVRKHGLWRDRGDTIARVDRALRDGGRAGQGRAGQGREGRGRATRAAPS